MISVDLLLWWCVCLFIIMDCKKILFKKGSFFYKSKRNGNGAALMSQNSKAKWSTAKFDQNAGFVCEKSQGSFCMFDLIPHSGSCYDFYLDPFASPVNWDVADDSK